MKRILSLLIFSAIGLTCLAQGKFKFDEEKYDFGKIKEGDVATHSFKFKNEGNEPIVITKVKASCGCTTPYWPKNPIPPGGSGEIKASYNSKGRPGNFHKSITVTSNATIPTKVLRINGVTEPAAPRVYTAEELANSPRATFTEGNYNFGNIELGQKVSHKFAIKNSGKSDLLVKNLKSSCNCVTFSLDVTSIKPGETGMLNVMYKPRVLGYRKEVVSVFTNDIVTNSINLILQGNVKKNTMNKSIINNDNKISF